MPATNWQALNFNEGKGTLEDQMRQLRGNRSFFGTRNINNYQDSSIYTPTQQNNGGDDGGTHTVYWARPDSGLVGSSGENGVFIKGPDGQAYMRVPLRRTDDAENGFSAAELGFGDDPEAIQNYLGIKPDEWAAYSDSERQHILETNYFHPDNSHGWGEVFYSPEYGFVMPTSSYRDPDARRDNALTAGMFAAVAAPAIAGIASAEGAGAATTAAETGIDTGGLEVGGEEIASSGLETTTPTTPEFTSPVETTTTTAAPSSGNGIIDGARNLWNGATQWYNGLSPASRFVLGQAASTGASALLQGNAQRNAQQYAEQQEQRARDDRARRGSVSAFKIGRAHV